MGWVCFVQGHPYLLMKRFQYLSLCALILLIGPGFRDFSAAETTPSKLFEEGMGKWLDDVETLEEAAVELEDNVSLQRLRSAYLECRRSFKQIEFILSHLDPEGVRDHINGAPLPHLERKAPEKVVLPPKGMQVLDELIFCEAPYREQKEIRKLCSALKVHAFRLSETHRHIRDCQVFIALRKGLIALFTLGVSGFDTPSSGMALEDARHALEGMQSFWSLYEEAIRSRVPELYEKTLATFGNGLEQLEAAEDFDSFDRLTFLTETINPLYDMILQAQLALGLELPSEVDPRPSPINYFSTNLFAEDFLNARFYSKLPAVKEEERTQLGEVLFFDPVLSENGRMSCGTCHQVDHGFAEPRPKSQASDGKGTLERNSMGLVNAVYAVRYFHDLRTDQLKKQVAHVVFAENEFNTNFAAIQNRLEASEEYLERFRAAFPQQKAQPVNQHTISSALAYYVATLRGFKSPFDRYVRGEAGELNPSVRSGFNLFMGKAACGTCHFPPTFSGLLPPMFSDSESEVLGVPISHDTLKPVLDPDLGRFDNGRPKEQADFYRHSFKTPTVRNIELTSPYMHNGAYADLESVLDFYDRGGGLGMGLDLPHQTLPGDPLNLTEEEKQDIIAFMKSLSNSKGF